MKIQYQLTMKKIFSTKILLSQTRAPRCNEIELSLTGKPTA